MSIYRKDVRHLDELDLYVLADLYDVKSHAVFHAIKKLICAGKRGAKDYEQDLMEAIESIERELQIIGLATEKDDAFCGDDPRVTADFDEQRIDVIGQNGNEGEHYEPAIKVEQVLGTILPEGLSKAILEKADWRNKVDWSLASPHHRFAYRDHNGEIKFSMHGAHGDRVERPSA